MSRLPDSVRHAVCYLRKSREDEEAELRGEDTLAKQRRMMIQDVLSHYPFAYDLREEVASGDSIKDRPVFRSILPQLGVRYQAIVCKDLSRLGRGSYGDMGTVYDVIRDRRIYIITKDAVYDPANFSDLRMVRFSLFFNREEYEMTLWRLTEGKYDGARKGKWVAGPVPYGFVYNTKTQVLEASEPESTVVQMVFSWYAREDVGLRAIASRLMSLGYMSPKGHAVWHPEVIRRMLKNPAYHGTLAFRRSQKNRLDGRVVRRPERDHIVVEQAFDALITDEDWQRVQNKLGGKTLSPWIKDTEGRSELAGIIKCKSCNKTLIRQQQTQQYARKDGAISRYHKEFLTCPRCRYSVKYRDCEQQILEALKQFPSIDRDQWDMIRIRQTRSCSRDEAPVDESIEDPVRKIQINNDRLIRAREFLLDGTLSKAEYLMIHRQIKRDLSRLNRQLAVRDLATDHTREHLDAIPAPTSIEEVYLRLRHPTRKNRLLKAIFAGVELELVSKGRGRNHPAQFNLYMYPHAIHWEA